MANKFCTKCGHKLSKNDIYCKSCNAVVDVKATTLDSGIKAKRKRSKAPIIVLAIVLPVILISAGIFSLFYFDVLDMDVIMSYFQNGEPEAAPPSDEGEYPDAYQYIIDKTVEAYPWRDNGNASPIPEIESASPLYSQGEYIHDIGFSMNDLNHDGTQELFVGLKTYTYGWVVIDIYTLHEGKTVHLAKADHYTNIIIKKDSSIILEWEDESALSHGCSNYKLPYDKGELEHVSGVVYDPNLAVEQGIITDISHAAEDNSWFNKTSVNGNDLYTPITGEDAQSYIDTLYQNLSDMEFTPAKLPDGMTTAVDTQPEETEPAPEEIKDYKVVIETSYSGENIKPVEANSYANKEFASLFVSVLESPDKSSYTLIDYNGETYQNIQMSYEPFMDSLNDKMIESMTGFVDPETMEYVYNESAGGHGGMWLRYWYIGSTGEVLTGDRGFTPLSEPLDFGVVCLIEESSEINYEYQYNGVSYNITNKYGIVVNSQLVVPCIYDEYKNYQDGICALKKDGMWTFFNENGEEIISGCFDSFHNSSYGYIALCRDGMWAYCDCNGNLVTDFVFEEARPVYRGMAWVKLDGYWKVIRLTGYEETFTEADARAAVSEYLAGSGLSTTVTLLNGSDSFSFYKSEGYCFRNGDGRTYIVLCNGDVYRLVS